MNYENEDGDDVYEPLPSDRTAEAPAALVDKDKRLKSEGLTGIVEPGQTEEFNFRKFQELAPDDVPCDIPEEEEEAIVCPSCIPNPEWKPDFNWKLDLMADFPNIFFDESTCEYVMITEEAVKDTSTFRNLGLTSLGVMIGDETHFVADSLDDGDRTRGTGDYEGAMKAMEDAELVSYNDTGCTVSEDGSVEFGGGTASKHPGGCKIWHDRIDAYKAHAVREMMIFYNKEVSDATFSAMYSVASPDGFYEDGYDWYLDGTRSRSSLVRVRVAIASHYFDNLPEAGPEDEANSKSPVEEVVLKAYDINKKVDRLKSAFEIYGKYQVYWFHTDGARLFIDYGTDTIKPLYLISNDGANQRDRLETFVSRLQDFCDVANYKFGEGLGGLFNNDTLAYEVKLQFDEQMKISAVYARKHGCDFDLLGGMKSDGSFRHLNKRAFKNLREMTGRAVAYYIAKIHEIDHDLRAKEPMPWLDFIELYTYPALKVDTGAGLPEQSLLGCFLEGEGYGEFFDCVLDQIISLPDVIAYKFQEFGCELIDKNQKVAVESAEAAYKKRTERSKMTKEQRAAQDLKEETAKSTGLAENQSAYDTASAAATTADTAAKENLDDAKDDLEAAEDVAKEAEEVYQDFLKDYRSADDEDGAALAAARGELQTATAAVTSAEDYVQSSKEARKEAKEAQREAKEEFKRRKTMIASPAQAKMIANANDALTDAGFNDTWSPEGAKHAKQSYEGMKDFLGSGDLAKEARAIKDWKKKSCGVYPRDGDIMDQMLPEWMQQIVIAGAGGGLKGIATLYRKIFARLTVCGILGLLMAGLECLLAGISFMDAMMILIKAALKEMPPYSLGKLFVGLPVDKQLEIEDKVRKQLKELNITAFVDMKAVMATSQKEMGVAAVALGEELQADHLAEVNRITQQMITDMSNADGEEAREAIAEKAQKDIDKLGERLEQGTQFLERSNKQVQESMVKTMDPSNASGVDSHGNPSGGGAQSSDKPLGKTTGDIVAPILKAYVEAIIDVYMVAPEELLNELNRIPGAALIARTLLLSRCPRAPLFHPPLFDFMKGFDFKFCRNGKAPIMPVLRPIDWVSWKALLKYLVKQAIKELIDLAIRLLIMIVIKVLQSVYNAICKLLQTGVNIAVTSTANAIRGESTDVYRILVESFCGPQPDQEQVEGVLTEIFQASGNSLNPPGQPPGSGDYIGQQSLVDPSSEEYQQASNDIVDYFQDFYSDVNTKEAVDLLRGQATRDTIAAATNLARQSANPVIRNSLSNPDQVTDMFRNINTILPAGALEQIESLQRNLEDEDLERPINSSFCATDAEVGDFYEALKTNFGDRCSPEQAESLARQHQVETVAMAQDLANIISGPLFKPEDLPRVFEEPKTGAAGAGPVDPCADSGADGDNALLPRETPATTALADESINRIFDAIESQYTEDLVGRKGIFNWILSDSIGVPYLAHMRKVNGMQKYVNSREEVESYLDLIDSIEDKDTKEAATISLFGEKKISKREEKKLLEKSTGYLPKTIGLHLQKIFDDFSPAGATEVLGEEIKSPQGVDVEVNLTTDVEAAVYMTNTEENDIEGLRDTPINVFTNKYTKKYISNNKKFIETAMGVSQYAQYSLAEASICLQTGAQLQEVIDDPDQSAEKAGSGGSIYSSEAEAYETAEDNKEYVMTTIIPSRKKADLKLTFTDRNFENAWTNDKKNMCDWATKFSFQTALFDVINDENNEPYVLDPGEDGDIGKIDVFITVDSRAKASDELDEMYAAKTKLKKLSDKEARSGPHQVDAYTTDKFLVVHKTEVNDYLKELKIMEKAKDKPPMHTAFCAMLEESIKYYNGTEEVPDINYGTISANFFKEEDYSALLTTSINGFMKPLGKSNKDAWLYGFDPGKAIIDPRAFEFGIKNRKPTRPTDEWTSYDDYRSDFKEGEFRPMHRAERKSKIMPITRYEYDKGKPHPRVHMLDPAVHGGSYDNPPIYVEPYIRDGWLGLLDKLMPEWDACSPRKADLINLDDIKQRVNELNSKIPDDPRLSFDEGCLVEEPYARILNRFSAAAMEGTVKATIRLAISEHFVNAISAFTTFKLSNDNFDEGFAAFILSNIKYCLKDRTNAGGWLWGGGGLSTQEYWFAFLEQCVQIWNRKYAVLGEIPDDEVSEQLVGALEQLNEIIESYAHPNAVHQTNRDDIWPRNKHHLAAAKERGEIKMFGTLKKLRRQRNLSIVSKTENLASIFALELIKEEMQYFSERVESVLGVKFTFENISQYFLDNLCVGSTRSYDQIFETVGVAEASTMNWFKGNSKFASKDYKYTSQTTPGTPDPVTLEPTPSTVEWARETVQPGGSKTVNPFQPMYDRLHGSIFLLEDERSVLEPLADDERETIKTLEDQRDTEMEAKKETIDELKSEPPLSWQSEQVQIMEILKNPDVLAHNNAIAEIQESLETPRETLKDLESQIDAKDDLISDAKSQIKELLDKVKQGGFVLQKYAIIKDRSEILAEEGKTEGPTQFHVEVPEYILNRASEYRGLVSLNSFKEFFSEMPPELKEVTERDGTIRPAKFSDYFSTFEYTYEIAFGILEEYGANLDAIAASQGLPQFDRTAVLITPETMITTPGRFIPSGIEEIPEPTGIMGKMGIEFGLRDCYFPSEARGEGAHNMISAALSADYEMERKAESEAALLVPQFFTRKFYERGLTSAGTNPPEGWERDNIFEDTNSRTYHKNTAVMIPIDDVRRYLIDIDLEAPSVEVLAEAGFEQMQMDQDLISDLEQLNITAEDEAEESGDTWTSAAEAEEEGTTATEISQEQYDEGLKENLAAFWETEGSTDRYEALLKGYGSMDGIYDLPCLRDEFSKEPGLVVLTEYILKLKRMTSMAVIYNSVCFPWSILQVTGDPDQVAKGKKELIRRKENAKNADWKRYTYGFFGIRGMFTGKFEKNGLRRIQGDGPYRKSFNIVKKLFVSLYNDRDFIDPDDSGAGGAKNFKELLKNMFGPNLDQSMKWWNRSRRRPFDANGDDCKTKLL